jgi:hypothetical protein
MVAALALLPGEQLTGFSVTACDRRHEMSLFSVTGRMWVVHIAEVAALIADVRWPA